MLARLPAPRAAYHPRRLRVGTGAIRGFFAGAAGWGGPPGFDGAPGAAGRIGRVTDAAGGTAAFGGTTARGATGAAGRAPSLPAGASTMSFCRKTISVAPARITSPSRSPDRWTFDPLTDVPLRLPRSSTTYASPSRDTRRWRRDVL